VEKKRVKKKKSNRLRGAVQGGYLVGGSPKPLWRHARPPPACPRVQNPVMEGKEALRKKNEEKFRVNFESTALGKSVSGCRFSPQRGDGKCWGDTKARRPDPTAIEFPPGESYRIQCYFIGGKKEKKNVGRSGSAKWTISSDRPRN